ncbi:uracil-xanthine permease [Ectopseudomonas oleovorans]|uniref:Uracil-xanthine permease n=1 Tax=Ectopseudomonas oleovorans TaxID=301 RepID=A0A379K0M2_ECTOL|nr:solute carrier family 23 protein [Pseudomonas oleovorans]SUD58208.1 uracil-xanthine permease [Pseudomonas oleovorans]
MTSTTQRPEDENLGLGSNLLYGLQHVLTMYGGIVAVPLIVGQAAGLSPADISLLIAASLFVGSATISRLSILLTMVIGTLVALAFAWPTFPRSVKGRCWPSRLRCISACRCSRCAGIVLFATERSLRYRNIAALHDGDHFIGGKLYNAQGNEVPLQDEDDHAPRARTTGATSRDPAEATS